MTTALFGYNLEEFLIKTLVIYHVKYHVILNPSAKFILSGVEGLGINSVRDPVFIAHLAVYRKIDVQLPL